MEIYSVESRKGGVGKTTIALNLAKALARRDYDVLLIDCDITGTPITKAAAHSEFWKKEVVVSLNEDREPYNLIDYFENQYLREENSGRNIIAGLDYSKRKIHLVGSEIYNQDGQLILDPRHLMNDLHSFWFLKMLRDIIEEFEKATELPNKAVILDNSPGYVGIGRSIREWLTSECPYQAKFILVSSLDEQDIDSTISSACEIKRMMGDDRDIRSYIKVVINRVPEELLEEGSGYKFRHLEPVEREELVKALFPLDKRNYPRNIIKYDKTISAQFIEASLLPKVVKEEAEEELASALKSFENKVLRFDQKQDQYGDIGQMNTYYGKLLKELEKSGYVRLSKSMGGTLQPSNMNKRLEDAVKLLGNMVHPDWRISEFSRDELKTAAVHQLYHFIEERRLSEYSPIFVSLLNGIYKVAGYDQKGGNIYQMMNLNILLASFYAFQMELYHPTDDNRAEWSYKAFLNSDDIKVRAKGFNENYYMNGIVMEVGGKTIHPDGYIGTLLRAYFSRFYQAMCYTLLRMIDCKQDYTLLIQAYKDTRSRKAKMMSESLTKYLKDVIVKKTAEPDGQKYRQLVDEPFEMRSIQNLLKTYVLK